MVDDGTLFGSRGSLSIDDEGTPTQRNILIEKVFLRIICKISNSRLMNVPDWKWEERIYIFAYAKNDQYVLGGRKE